ncbi:MAG: nucleotide exchange factor GrpE [Candidatus Puniceispirillaceae bacterium]
MAKKTDEPATSSDDDKVSAGTSDMLENQAEDALADAPEETAPEKSAPTDDPVMAALFEERDSLKDQLLRALADVENMRRRTERELESARKYAHTGFARDLVGAIDNLSRAIDAAPAADEAPSPEALSGLFTGLEMSWTEIQSTMERHGIKRVDPKGEKFDYNLHQAMFEVPSDTHEPGTVVEVVQHGYVLHDRLLRPAMVGVAKAADTEASESGDSE